MERSISFGFLLLGVCVVSAAVFNSNEQNIENGAKFEDNENNIEDRALEIRESFLRKVTTEIVFMEISESELFNFVENAKICALGEFESIVIDDDAAATCSARRMLKSTLNTVQSELNELFINFNSALNLYEFSLLNLMAEIEIETTKDVLIQKLRNIQNEFNHMIETGVHSNNSNMPNMTIQFRMMLPVAGIRRNIYDDMQAKFRNDMKKFHKMLEEMVATFDHCLHNKYNNSLIISMLQDAENATNPKRGEIVRSAHYKLIALEETNWKKECEKQSIDSILSKNMDNERLVRFQKLIKILARIMYIAIDYKEQKGSKKFHVTQKSGNWFQANIYCMSRNMRLASIKSTKEQNELTKQFEVNTKIETKVGLWLSGTCQGTGRNFYWFGQNEEIDFTQWAIGQPKNGDVSYECMAHHGFGNGGRWWFDYKCLTNPLGFYYICEHY